MPDFESFAKIPRVDKVGVWITEKIDGTNAQILIQDGLIYTGSRNRWISVTDNASSDNFGFARWVADNQDLLLRLGPGRHFGEWYGAGIGRRYGMTERRFALFDRMWAPNSAGDPLVGRGLDAIGVQCVPLLATCSIADLGPTVAYALEKLARDGSVLVPGWMQPEGIVVQIQGSAGATDGPRFKITDNGNRPKWQNGVSNPEAYKPEVLQPKGDWGQIQPIRPYVSPSNLVDAMDLFKAALADKQLSGVNIGVTAA